MKLGLKLALGMVAAVFVTVGAVAGEVSVPAKAGYSPATSLESWQTAGCRQVCTRKVLGKCVSYRQVCSGAVGAVRG